MSANGSAWMLPAADGWVALNLARPGDRELVAAWFGQLDGPPWSDAVDQPLNDLAVSLMPTTRGVAASTLVAAGRLVGLPIAAVPTGQQVSPAPNVSTTPYRTSIAAGAAAIRTAPPRVLDLSAMWAGPLASQLLRHAGAVVTRVEGPTRRDGFLTGDPVMYDQLNEGKVLRLLDPANAGDRAEIAAEVATADLVISSSRRRVFPQWGIEPEAVADRGGVWVAISGYGWFGSSADANAVAFGDDAAVAAGAFGTQDQDGALIPTFVGDALADPVTGVTAALAALRSWQSGAGAVIDVSMVNATRWHRVSTEGHHG